MSTSTRVAGRRDRRVGLQQRRGSGWRNPAPDLISINNSYGEAQVWQPPGMVRLSVTYDY
ncbi:hypothetical protein [Rhodanobacter aciditrophus]|uniref:hypothetical protein n=1 Tax=Rhodanobacter aciditrophus TaxID=1623218 RepID=UPI003CF39CC8